MAAKMLRFVNVYGGSANACTKKLGARICQGVSLNGLGANWGADRYLGNGTVKAANRQMRVSPCLGETALGTASQ